MKAVVQRVSRAEVVVAGQCVGQIGEGILALVAISRNDTEKDLLWMARKIVELRIFDDHEGKLNLSLQDVKGQLLVVSQFTLYGDCRKGRLVIVSTSRGLMTDEQARKENVGGEILCTVS